MAEVMRRRWAGACSAAAGAVVVGILWLSGESPDQGPGDEKPTQSFAHFSVAGDSDRPISPGVTVSLNLEVTNPHDQPLTVTDLVVTLQVAHAPNADPDHPCTGADFTVVQASEALPLSLPARRTSTLQGLALPENRWPRFGMLNRNVNQDGCKGSTIALRYSATGKVGS